VIGAHITSEVDITSASTADFSVKATGTVNKNFSCKNEVVVVNSSTGSVDIPGLTNPNDCLNINFKD